VNGLRRRVDEPLQLALAGRVKAGKSTLLNALVGERLAPTDASECTRVVTVYRFALGYQVAAILRDGASADLPFRRADGVLEIELGSLTIGEIERIEVGWPSAALRAVTLVDTPGLASADDANSLRTREFLGLEDERANNVDAVIYMMRHMHRTDAEFLDSFLDRSVGHVSPVNCVAVLSRADEIGASRIDALESAARIAARYRADERLHSLTATVIPLAGLIAETGLTLREFEAQALRELAQIDTRLLRVLLLSADGFTAPAISSPNVEIRRALLDRLGLFGLRLTLSALKSGRATTAADISRLLVDASGLTELRRVIEEHFMTRAQTLKARSVLIALTRIAQKAPSTPAGKGLRANIERLAVASTEFAELRLAHLALSGSVRFDEVERQEVERLTIEETPAVRAGLSADADRETVAATALDAIARWRVRAEDPLADPVTQEAAGIAVRAYETIYASSTRALPLRPRESP
jgi:hypothetical protein